MNLKYYLRGLGIGIVVTAVIMGATSGGKRDKMSDAEIKARAAELGMVEAQAEGVLADLEQKSPEEAEVRPEDETGAVKDDEVEKSAETPSPEPEETPSPEPEETSSPEPEETPSPEPEETSSPKPEETPSPEPAETSSPESEAAPSPVPEKTPEDEKTDSADGIMIEIKEGEGSYTVCRKLEDAGLIASASAFDAYLYENGFDRKLRIGTYEIPAGSEPEAIAEILAFGR